MEGRGGREGGQMEERGGREGGKSLRERERKKEMEEGIRDPEVEKHPKEINVY